MVIDKKYIGANCRKVVYDVCADATETGDGLHAIVRLDSLELATIVMRYMRGDSLSEADEYRAHEAIRKADVPTNDSKRARKAD